MPHRDGEGRKVATVVALTLLPATADVSAARADPLAEASHLSVLVGLLLAGLGGLAVAAAPPAAAHAVLELTSPFDGESLTRAPDEVRLEFSEPVSASAGAVRVYDSTGGQVASGNGEGGGDPSVLRAGLPDGLSEGTYVVTWRAVSADGHPVKGAAVGLLAGGGALWRTRQA